MNGQENTDEKKKTSIKWVKGHTRQKGVNEIFNNIQYLAFITDTGNRAWIVNEVLEFV